MGFYSYTCCYERSEQLSLNQEVNMNAQIKHFTHRFILLGTCCGLALVVGGFGMGNAAERSKETDSPKGATSESPSEVSQQHDKANLLPEHRVIFGTVEAITGEQIKVNTGELQPRFLSLKIAKDKGLPEIKPGDRLEITLNDNNAPVDYHHAGAAGRHRVVRGELATSLVIGQDRALIRTESGKEESYEVTALAKSKLAALPVGSEALFFLDESNKIADATFGSQEAVERRQSEQRTGQVAISPVKGAHLRIVGRVVKSLKANRVSIKKDDGKEETYEVRQAAQEKLSQIQPGELIILLLDDENKVIEVAKPEGEKKG
jgi:TusA-related sulfurtransferase